MYGISSSLLALLFIGALLLFAKMAEEFFERLRLVPYVAAVFVGIIIGPGVLNLITVLPNISLFISLGINFLLFTAGALEFKEIEMNQILRARSLLIGIIEFIVPFSLITVTAYLLLHSILIAIIAGIVMGMSSAGPLTRLLSDTGLNRTQEGNRIFQQVVIIEISAVILFSFVSDLHGKTVTPVIISVIAVKLAVALILVVLFGKYVLTRFLAKIDLSSKAHETLIAVIVAFMLILGFVGQYYGFNSAIIALFLGIILRDFIRESPIVAEKVSTITYGFFEPLFFVGLGLYFVRITLDLLILGTVLFIIGLVFKPIAGAIFSRSVNVGRVKNALGTSVNGGVDAALLVVALSFALVSRFDYSIIMFAITLLTLVVPMIFNIGTPVIPVNKSRFIWNLLESQFKNMKAGEIADTLPNVSVNSNDRLGVAFQVCINQNTRAVIVTDSQNRVAGQLTLRDMISMGEDQLRTLSVRDANITSAIKVNSGSSGSDLIKIFREYDPPVVAVVNNSDNFVGTILERETMKHVSNLLSESSDAVKTEKA